ncbi:unnamed protein product [Symbiodinium natans]|uniref:Uncharacterized protein n=1 Tax=Symbiodinium natans TaxID=878477 RepID=A0A812SFY5_9DINO|nr:unnamed protein product [Symbiodinium natans]
MAPGHMSPAMDLGSWWADGMPSLLSITWHGRTTFGAEAAQAPASLSRGVAVSLALASVVFLAFAYRFLDTGAGYIRGQNRNCPRTQVFHLFFAGSASFLAAVRLGTLGSEWSEQHLDPVLGLSLGRAGACLLLSLALGRAAGAPAREVAPVAVLFAVSWLQLGLSSVSSQLAMRLGLFCSGSVCAAVAAQSLAAAVESSQHTADVKERLLMVMSLVQAVTILSLLAWMATMKWQLVHEEHTTRGALGLALDSLLDLLGFCGTGHLLLKDQKQAVLDSICQQLACPRAAFYASCDQSDTSSNTSVGQSSGSEISASSESPPLFPVHSAGC